MVWAERDHEDCLVPTLCHGLGYLPLDQVAQSSIQAGPGHLQEWRNDIFTQTLLMLHYSHSEEFFPDT